MRVGVTFGVCVVFYVEKKNKQLKKYSFKKLWLDKLKLLVYHCWNMNIWHILKKWIFMAAFTQPPNTYVLFNVSYLSIDFFHV